METTRPHDNLLIRHATAIAISTLTALMLLMGVVLWRQESASAQSTAWVNHTYEVLGHIQLFLNQMTNAEVGQRGYLISNGDAEYLEPYDDALREAPAQAAANSSLQQHRSIIQEMALIRRLTTDNPAQQSNLDEMDGVVNEMLDYLATTIKAHQNQESQAAAALDFSRGKKLMDHVRSLVRIMESEENHLLALRTEANAINSTQNTRMTYGGLGVFYLAMVLAIWVYQNSRARAAAQMLTYTRELERSEEELKMQQEELKASNEEIEASNEELEEKTKALEEQNVQIQQQAARLEESQRLIEEKAAEVERASRYKSEFLANMSHELRTPLNSLLILAKMLAANEPGNLTAEQVEEAQVIHNGGLELLGLINDILDLSKVEAGKLSLNVEDVALEGIVARIQQQFAPVSKEKGVAFPIRLAEGLPATLRTDTQRVEQILKNLLSNAFKFTEQGSVTLEIRRATAGEMQRSAADGAAVAFTVVDTGIGISPTKFKDIFEAFQQEDGSIDRHYGGTGLGLTIARKFAHMLGGEIHVSSIKGQGSTFTLVLPVSLLLTTENNPAQLVTATPRDTQPAEAQVPAKTMALSFIADDRKNISGKDKVLLVIEDDAAFAATLMKLARKRGYKCLAAGNGKSGLLLAVEQPVTAVILDLKLPDIDGMNVLDQLKANLRTRHIPVHIISGRAEADSVMPLRKGAIGYLAKPAEAEAIDGVFAKIEGLLQSQVRRVLVVEDDKKNQLAIENLLKKKDVEITVVGTSTAASAAVEKTSFDCVILDLQLPDMTGFDWLEKMEAEQRTLPPVVVYTARELSEDENRKLNRYTGSIIIKGAKSPERLLDEVTLFLHSVESTLSADQQQIIRMQHNPDKALIGRTVLLTDDDLRNTFALSKLLKAHGMNIVIADNGQMALDKLKEDVAIELVIMDIMMPVMDGYQAMREIRAQKAHQHLPIIALTARAMPDEREKCMAAGANDYLTKPVDIEQLLALLRVCLFRQELAA